MAKGFVVGIVFMAAVAGLTACSRSKATGGLHFETLVTERSVSIDSEAGAPQCRVRLELAAPTGSDEAAREVNAAVALELLGMEGVSLREAADSFANSYTRSYLKDFGPLYREDADDPARKAWYEYHYNISSEVTAGREGVAVYKAVVDYYEGGAHGVSQQLFMNFDTRSGRRLTLSDFFVPGFEQPLSFKLLQALMALTGTGSVDELREKGYLYETDMFATENFAAGSKGFTFVYNPYEIAPYSEGIIRLDLEADELGDVLKKD